MSHRPFKNRLYAQFARVSSALASEKRLELLDLLAQAPRHVEALAAETEMSVANVSQHLQALRNARLVESEREGNRVLYRLAGEDILRLWLDLRSVAQHRLPDVRELAQQYGLEMSDLTLGLMPGSEVPRDELEKLVHSGGGVVIDVRPAVEFDSGHIPGAVSLPIEDLPARLADLPKDKRIVAYCRGAFCLFADEAVTLLRSNGFDAIRIKGGWAEWKAEGRDIE